MNAEHLEALVIDQSLGELPEDVSALLTAYLAAHPQAGEEAVRIRSALGVAQSTMQQHPELIRDSGHEIQAWALGRMMAGMLQTRTAFAVLMVPLAGILGFVLGDRQPSGETVAQQPVAQQPPADVRPIPWARYEIADSRLGSGLSVVVASMELESSSQR